VPVSLRRHLVTKKVADASGNKVRVVKFGGAKGAVLAGRMLRIESRAARVKSYSSTVARAVAGARAAQRAFRNGGKVSLRKELSLNNALLDEKIYVEILESKKYAGDEAKMVADWIKGDNLGGSVVPAKPLFESIIRRRLGLGLAAEAGKAGFGRKAIPIKGVLLDSLTHSALVEPVVERLTRGLPNHFEVTKLVDENKGIMMHFPQSTNGKYHAVLTYEGKLMGDVTKNFRECMLPSLRKYLDA